MRQQGTKASLSTIAALLSILTIGARGGAEAMKIDFEDSPIGAAPVGFSMARTNGGEPGRWLVEEDATAPSGGRVLVQRSTDPTSGRFPLCLYDGVEARDVEAAVGFKPISGAKDQAAGIVWRYRDPDNYYIVRANALEGNVVLYKVENGKRSDLKPIGAGLIAYGKKVEVPSGRWSTLRVVARGSRFTVSLGGAHLFDVEDATFEGPGKVGLWTKADSVTAFDALLITPAD